MNKNSANKKSGKIFFILYANWADSQFLQKKIWI
jgi:hypothetical protein